MSACASVMVELQTARTPARFAADQDRMVHASFARVDETQQVYRGRTARRRRRA